MKTRSKMRGIPLGTPKIKILIKVFRRLTLSIIIITKHLFTGTSGKTVCFVAPSPQQWWFRGHKTQFPSVPVNKRLL